MTQHLSDATLLAYLHKVLDPGRLRAIRAEVAVDSSARRRLEALTREEASTPPPPSLGVPLGAWGWAAKTHVAPAAVMAAKGDRVRVGDRLRIRFEPPPEPGACVWVLWRGAASWHCHLPSPNEADLPVSMLPLDAAGLRWLDVVAQPAQPRQRWVVLVGAPGSLDRSNPSSWGATIARGALERSLLAIVHEVDVQCDAPELGGA